MQTSWSHRSKFLLVPNSPPPPLRLEHPITFILIRPKLILNKRVMSISSQRCNLSRRISERATFNVLAISPCTGLQIHWSWMRWNGNLMELLNINFLLLVQLWTRSQIDENSCVLLGFRRCWRSWLKFFWSWTHGSASSCMQNILNTHYPRGDGRE